MYYNPDEAAREYQRAHPEASIEQANSAAWEFGRHLLKRAIRERLDYTFETTLGGNTIRSMLEQAAAAGLEVRVWYTGLASVDLHLERVQQRVRGGGHDIPSETIRRRYKQSIANLVWLMPALTSLVVYDNSAPADPATGAEPRPVLLLQLENGRIQGPEDLSRTPEWAKPIVARAMELDQAPR